MQKRNTIKSQLWLLNKAQIKQNAKALAIALIFTLGLFVFMSAPVLAQGEVFEPTPEQIVAKKVNENSKSDFLSLSIENDTLGGGTDQFYTSGVRLTYFNTGTDVPAFMETVDDVVPTFDINNTTSTYFSIGQNIYTPQNIRIRDPQNKDRPWAAFMYGSVGLVTLDDYHLDELELTLGIVGPEALGEQTQKLVHKHVTDSPIPKGWSNQLDFEPGLILSWQRRWPRAFRKDFGDYRFRVEPNINVSVGNIYTYAGTGAMIMFGPHKNVLQDTPPRVRPAVPGSGYFETPDDGWNWQLFAGADMRAVGRNIFLDGNTFKSSDSVDKKYFVGDLTAGFAVALHDYRLSYSLNYRTDEFDGQSDDSVFGSLTLSTRF